MPISNERSIQMLVKQIDQLRDQGKTTVESIKKISGSLNGLIIKELGVDRPQDQKRVKAQVERYVCLRACPPSERPLGQQKEAQLSTQLPPLQWLAFTFYSHGGDYINHFLREEQSSGTPLSPQWLSFKNHLDNAIKVCEANPDLAQFQKTYRGVTQTTFFASKKEGDTLSDPAYLSSTTNVKVARNFATKAPEEAQDNSASFVLFGKKGVNVDAMTVFNSEDERLIARNTEFRILLKDDSSTLLREAKDAKGHDMIQTLPHTKVVMEESDTPKEQGTQERLVSALVDLPLKKPPL